MKSFVIIMKWILWLLLYHLMEKQDYEKHGYEKLSSLLVSQLNSVLEKI